MEVPELLKSRIDEAGLIITDDPPRDGLCFYRAAGYQLDLSGETVRDRVFEYLEKNRYDVSILFGCFLVTSISHMDVIKKRILLLVRNVEPYHAREILKIWRISAK